MAAGVRESAGRADPADLEPVAARARVVEHLQAHDQRVEDGLRGWIECAHLFVVIPCEILNLELVVCAGGKGKGG